MFPTRRAGQWGALIGGKWLRQVPVRRLDGDVSLDRRGEVGLLRSDALSLVSWRIIAKSSKTEWDPPQAAR